MNVGRVSSATRHCQPRSGHAGSPSSITIDERTRSAATSAFHIIHEVVLNQSRRPPGLRSQLNACALRYSSRMPPCPWTIAFGRPVVPDENSTNSGWSNATGRNAERRRLGEQLVPGERVGNRVLAVGDVHDVAQAGKGGADRRHLLAPVDRAVAIAVATDRQQDGRLELHEAVDDAARAELGGAAREHRAEARRRRERHQRLGDVRHVGDDAVARADAEPLQPGAGARHQVAQLPEGHLDPVARLGVRDDGDLVSAVVGADQVLGEVEARAREPGRARHRIGRQRRRVRGVRLDLEEVPDRRPERGQVRDRPVLQVLVRGEREPALALEPGEVATDLGRLAHVRRRRPEDASGSLVAGAERHWGACRWPMRDEMSRAVRVTAGPKRAVSSSFDAMVRCTARLSAATTSPVRARIGDAIERRP